MYKVIIATLTTLFAMFPGASSADVLWGKAEAGASETEVATLYPEGVRVDPSPRNALKSGAVLLYKVDGIEIGQDRFTSSFYFLNDKLFQVTLSLRKTDSDTACARAFDEIVAALRSKYGQEVRSQRSGSLGLRREVDFSSGKTSARGYVSASGGDCSISVFYNQSIGAVADKL